MFNYMKRNYFAIAQLFYIVLSGVFFAFYRPLEAIYILLLAIFLTINQIYLNK